VNILSYLFSFWPIDFGRASQVHFRSEAERFAQCRVRMDRVGDIASRAAHFDGDHRFGNELARAGADDTTTEHTVRCRIDDPTRQTVGSAVCDRPTAGLPGVNGGHDIAAR